MVTGLVARGEAPLPIPGPGEVGIVCIRSGGAPVAVVAADEGAWDRYQAGDRAALRREDRLVYLRSGTLVKVIAARVADGAVEVRITEGPRKGRVGWVSGSDVVTPGGYELIRAGRARLAEERKRGIDRLVARREREKLIRARRLEEACAVAEREAKEQAEFEVKMAPIRAQQERDAAHLEVQRIQAAAAAEIARSYSLDVDMRSIYRYGAPATLGPGGRMVPYGSR
jgi:hypothetical protein